MCNVGIDVEVYDDKGCLHTVPAQDTSRHIVPPPAGTVTLVCCQSTKGSYYDIDMQNYSWIQKFLLGIYK
jgi:hypothetical protein